jgi:hypothetical protein
MADRYEFIEIGDAADAIREHVIINRGEFPEHARDRLLALTRTGTSPVDMIVGFVRAVYANRDEVPTSTKRMAIGAADLIQMKGFYGGLDGNAGKVSAALSRETGLKAPAGRSWPAKEEDPEPAADWLAPPVAAEEADDGQPANGG